MSISRIDPSAKAHAIAPTLTSPSFVDSFTKSSITPQEDHYLAKLCKEEKGPFSAPKLSNDRALLHSIEELYHTEQGLLHASTQELRLGTKLIEEQLALQAELLRNKTPQDNSAFSWLDKMSACTASALYVAYGASLVQAGSISLGALFVAAGSLTLSYHAIQSSVGMEAFLNFCRCEQTTLQKIKDWTEYLMPKVSLLAGLGIPFISYMQPHLAPSGIQLLSSLQQATYIIKELGNAQRTTTLVELSPIEDCITLTNKQQANLLAWLKAFMEGLRRECEQVKHSIELTTQTLRGTI